MAQVTIEVNGRPYQVGCEDGQEQHLRDLAAEIDKQVRSVAQEVGQLGDTRLLLMAALLMADEISESKRRLGVAQADLLRAQSEHAKSEQKAIASLERAAEKIEKLAE
jgi:cell division protein ZapA